MIKLFNTLIDLFKVKKKSLTLFENVLPLLSSTKNFSSIPQPFAANKFEEKFIALTKKKSSILYSEKSFFVISSLNTFPLLHNPSFKFYSTKIKSSIEELSNNKTNKTSFFEQVSISEKNKSITRDCFGDKNKSKKQPNLQVGIIFDNNGDCDFPKIGGNFFSRTNAFFDNLKEKLNNKQIVNLYGESGVGKTQTAIWFAHKEEYTLKIYININNTDLMSLLAQLKEKFNYFLNSKIDEKKSLVDQIYDIFKSQKKILLILDNVENFKVIKSFLYFKQENKTTSSSNIHMLIISNEPHQFEFEEKIERIKLDKINCTGYNSIITHDIPETMVRSIEERVNLFFGGNFVLFSQIIAHINHSKNKEKFLTLLKTGEKDKIYSCILQELSDSQNFWRALIILSYLRADMILLDDEWNSVFGIVTDITQLNSILAELNNYRFIDRYENYIKIHQVTQKSVRNFIENLKNKEKQESTFNLLENIFLSIIDSWKTASPFNKMVLQDHLCEFISGMQQNIDHLTLFREYVEPVCDFAESLYTQGAYLKASQIISFVKELQNLVINECKKNNTITPLYERRCIKIQLLQGKILRRNNKFDEAIRLFSELNQTLTNSLPIQSGDMMIVKCMIEYHNTLGEVYRGLANQTYNKIYYDKAIGEYYAALKLLKDKSNDFEKNLYDDEKITINTNLANACICRGSAKPNDIKKILFLLEQLESKNTVNHIPKEKSSENNNDRFRDILEHDFQVALYFYKQIHTFLQRGSNNKKTKENIAKSYADIGFAKYCLSQNSSQNKKDREQEAVDLYNRAITEYKKIDKTHFRLTQTHIDLNKALNSQGKWAKGLNSLRQAFIIGKENYSTELYMFMQHFHNPSIMWETKYCDKVIDLEDSNIDVQDYCICNLMLIGGNTDSLKEIEKSYCINNNFLKKERAISIIDDNGLYGSNHPETAERWYYLGRALANKNDLINAVECYKNSMMIMLLKKGLGETLETNNLISLAKEFFNLYELYHERSDNKSVMITCCGMLMEILDILEKNNIESIPLKRNYKYGLRLILNSDAKLDDAMELFKTNFPIFIKQKEEIFIYYCADKANSKEKKKIIQNLSENKKINLTSINQLFIDNKSQLNSSKLNNTVDITANNVPREVNEIISSVLNNVISDTIVITREFINKIKEELTGGGDYSEVNIDINTPTTQEFSKNFEPIEQPIKCPKGVKPNNPENIRNGITLLQEFSKVVPGFSNAFELDDAEKLAQCIQEAINIGKENLFINNDQHLLDIAFNLKKTNCMNVLIEKGLGDMEKALCKAAQAGYLEVVRKLVEEKGTAIEYTTELQVNETIKKIIGKQTIPCNALHLAIIYGHSTIVLYLLEKFKKNIGKGISIPQTASVVDLAILFKRHDVLEQLLLHASKYEIDVNTCICADQSPLALAALLEDVKAIKILNTYKGRKGVNINKTNSKGETALHVARTLVVFQTLIEVCGINHTIKGNHRKTAEEVIRDLREHPQSTEKEKNRYQMIENYLITIDRVFPIEVPENLVIQGGGPKGIAYVGALEELETIHKQNFLKNIKRVCGTSAGAIVAMLIAIGYQPQEIRKELEEQKDLSKLLEQPESINKINEASQASYHWFFKACKTVVVLSKVASQQRKKGIGWRKIKNIDGVCSGEMFRNWIEKLIYKKTDKKHLTFGELRTKITNKEKGYKHLYVVATQIEPSENLTVFSSEQDETLYENVIISDAIRASMSLPFIFFPHTLHHKSPQGYRIPLKEKYIDGGVLRNYYVNIFDKLGFIDPFAKGDEKSITFNSKTLGLSLYSKKEPISDIAIMDLQQQNKEIENWKNQNKGMPNFLLTYIENKPIFGCVEIKWNVNYFKNEKFEKKEVDSKSNLAIFLPKNSKEEIERLTKDLKDQYKYKKDELCEEIKLYIDSSSPLLSLLEKVGNVYMNAEVLNFNDFDKGRTIKIDNCGVKTWDFNVSPKIQEKLIQSGKDGVKKFYKKFKRDGFKTSTNEKLKNESQLNDGGNQVPNNDINGKISKKNLFNETQKGVNSNNGSNCISGSKRQ